MATQSRGKVEFGDFQTPPLLAREAVALVRALAPQSATIIEPTVGVGAFLAAAGEPFPAAKLLGFDINHDHCTEARTRLADFGARASVQSADFFHTDWRRVVQECAGPVLFLGNPPWVTSAGLGLLESHNVPAKSNFQGHRGLDARTGRSNFDISEWMLLQLMDAIEGTEGSLAFLVKSAVARKLFLHAATKGLRLADFRCHRFDAKLHFGVATQAVLFFCRGSEAPLSGGCHVYASIQDRVPESTIALRAGRLVADAEAFDRQARFCTAEPYPWRSGLKHDLAKVMELVREDGVLRNGLGAIVEIEDEHLFPLVKSSDLGAGTGPDRWVIVPQRHMREATARLETEAPRTWAYLQHHAELFAQRKSSIHRGAEPFSIFGIGEYSFSPWKVAVSSLHRNQVFRPLGPREGKPCMVDDASYFLPCRSQAQAMALVGLLDSTEARELLASLLFDDTKRILTKDVLAVLDLDALGGHLGVPADVRWRTVRKPGAKLE